MKAKQVGDKVINGVISLEASKGHLKWKVSDLARYTKVNRSLIYYHLGKTKKEIFSKCVTLTAEEFFGLSRVRTQMVAGGNLLQSVLITREMFMQNTGIVEVWLKLRTQSTPFYQNYK